MEVDSLGSRRIDSDTIRAYIQEYIRRAPSAVTAEEIKSVLSERYGLEGTAWKRLVYNSVGIVRVGARQFVHADRLSLRPDPEGFRPVIDYINSWLDAEGLVNARMVFRDQAKVCASLGIISPDHLYTILETSYSFDYDLPWFPQIVKWGVRRPGIRTCGVTSEVEDYLERRSCECTYSELLTYFVEERCYLKSAVTRIAKSPKVARYTPHSVIHLRTLGWTDRLQEALEDCALSHLRSHQPAGDQHARLSALMEDPALPSLPAQHSWTTTLLGDLLCRRDSFALSTIAGERCFAASRYDMAEDTSPHEPAPSAGNPVSSAPEPTGTPSTEDPYSEAVARLSERAALVLKAHGVGDLQGLLSIRESRLRITLGATEETVDEILRVRDDLILGSHAASELDGTSGASFGGLRPPAKWIRQLNRPPEPMPARSVGRERAKAAQAPGCPAEAFKGGPLLPKESLDGLTVRARNVLGRQRIATVEQLLALSEQDLDKFPNAGAKTVGELVELQKQLRDAESVTGQIVAANAGTGHRVEHPDDPSVVSLAIGLGPEQAIAGCVADLGLSEGDLVGLRGIAVYPEDSLDSLSRLAPGVLASCGISETGFQAILGKCTSLANLELRDTPIVQEADAIGMEGWSVRTVGVPWRDAETLRAAGISVLGDALGRSEKSIVDLLGLSIRSLTYISLLWQLKTYAKRARLSMPPAAYVSFDSAVRRLTEPSGSRLKDVRAHKLRTGLHDGTMRTLKEAGREMGISASRVAQLQARQELRLNRPSSRERLGFLFGVIRGILEDCGGACTDAELARHLTERFAWPSCPDAGQAVALASLDPSLCLSNNRRLVSFASPYPCLVCEIPMKAIADAAREAPGAIRAGDCANIIEPVISQTCRQCGYHRPLFSRGYVLLRAASCPELQVEDDRIMCIRAQSFRRDAMADRSTKAVSDWLNDLGSWRPLVIDASGCNDLADFNALLDRLLSQWQPLFLGRIEMVLPGSERLIQLIADELKASVSRPTCAQYLAERYPCAIAYALVQLTASAYSSGGAWPGISRRLGVHQGAISGPFGQSLEACQQRYSLAVLEREETHRFFSQMLFQAGIPDSCLPDLIKVVWAEYAQPGPTVPEEVLQRFRADLTTRRRRELRSQLPEPAADFLEHGGKWAEQWIVVTAVFLSSRDGLPAELREVAPARLLRALEKWVHPPTLRKANPRPPEPPPPPKPKRKPLRSRRARVQTRFDLAARRLVVRIGEHELEGDFSGQVHVCAILRDGDGVELESRILDASRAPKGALVRSADIGLPVVEGDLTLDIEYAGDVLQSYPVETLLADEPCMLFSSSGGLVRGAVRDSDGACMLLREGAQVLPEDAVRSRELLRQGEPYDLAWLDMRACVDEGLVVQWNGAERAFQVATGRGGRGVVLDGGDRVSRVSVDAQHPVYGGNMPDAVIEPKLSRLRLAVRVFDTGRLPECTVDSDGRVNLGQALERLGVPKQSAAMIDLAWTDSTGKSGKLSVARIPDLRVSFDKRAYVPERDKVARARLSLPSGWELVPGPGIVRIDSGRDDAEIDVEIDLERLPGNARLRLGDAEVPIAIQPPTVQWRVESRQKGGEGPWRSMPAEIWAEDVDTDKCGALAVMVDADCPVKVALGPSRPQWCTQENKEARFNLAEQVQAIRGRGPAGTLRLALVDSGRRQMPPIDVATVLDKWVPVNPAATVEPIGPPAPPGRQIRLGWGGPAPRGPVGMALRPAWTDSKAFQSSVGAGAHSCTFSADRAVCGPYILTMENAAADDWGESADPYGEMLVWVGGSEPQIRKFELVRRGDSWVCSGVVYPGTECSDLIGVVVRSRAGGRVDTVGISHLGDGRFRFAVDDPREDAGIVGVLSATRRGHDGLYRFKAVEHGPGCSEMLRRSSVNQWLSLSRRFPDAVKMWIGGCDVKPIPVPREAGRRILRELAAGCTAVRFSPDDPGYGGAVELVIPDDERDDPCAGFQLSFASMIVKCIDDGCARKGEVLSQAKWNAEHGPRCKRCRQLGREIRAGFAMQIDTSSTGGRNAFDSTIADSCFRVLPDNPAAMLDEARLGQALMDALWGMWRTLGAAPTDGEEIES